MKLSEKFKQAQQKEELSDDEVKKIMEPHKEHKPRKLQKPPEETIIAITTRPTIADLIAKVRIYIENNPNKPKVKRAKKHLSLIWGGHRKHGGGWNGAWLHLLDILAEVL